MEKTVIETVEMHTGGEPLRIVKSGYSSIVGDTILDKRNYAKMHLDHLRKFLMFEPRGHYDMYGALQVKPDLDEADVAFLFTHNEGYSTMCGHAVIALGRYCIDNKMVEYNEPETKVNIQCPCGLVSAYVKCLDGKTGSVRFHSVPSFAYALDFTIVTSRYGKLNIDISYGGACYGILPLSSVGLSLDSPISRITEAATVIKQHANEQMKFIHPSSSDLSFYYGIIFTDDNKKISKDSKLFNLTVFAEAQVDRSPCGSGSIARTAALFAKKLISIDQVVSFENPLTHSVFQAKVIETSKVSKHEAVVVEISGKANYTGTASFTYEEDDPLKSGFIIS